MKRPLSFYNPKYTKDILKLIKCERITKGVE